MNACLDELVFELQLGFGKKFISYDSKKKKNLPGTKNKAL